MDAQLRHEGGSVRPEVSGYVNTPEPLQNGVAEPSRPSASSNTVATSMGMENANLQDPAPVRKEIQMAGLTTTPPRPMQNTEDPPYGMQQQLGANVTTAGGDLCVVEQAALGERVSPGS